MNFLFEITPDYIPGYKGEEILRAKIYYEISSEAGIINTHVDIPFNCLPYIVDNIRLSAYMWDAVLKHAEALLEEEKDFSKKGLTSVPSSEEHDFSDIEAQEKYLL